MLSRTPYIKSPQYAGVEIFESKPALFFEDPHMQKIGGFIAKDFTISIGQLGEKTSGQVSYPTSGVSVSRQPRIGDVCRVSIFGMPSDDLPTKTDGLSSVGADATPFSRAFVITAIDTGRLILQDYVAYNLSLVSVGYVGKMVEEPLYRTIVKVTQRSMRAFAAVQYPPSVPPDQYDDQADTCIFDTSASVFSATTTFEDDFKTTDVTPYDVVVKALQGADITKDTKSDLKMGAVVEEDDQGFYVRQYIWQDLLSDDDARNYKSIALKPSASPRSLPTTSDAMATIWIQPQDNGDEYYRGGLIFCKSEGEIVSSEDITEDDYKAVGLQKIPSTLVGYKDISEGLGKKPIGDLSSKSSYTPEECRQIVKNIGNLPKDSDLYKKLLGSLKPLDETINLSFSLSDIIQTPYAPLLVKGGELLKVSYAGAMGEGWSNIKCRCTSIELTQDDVKVTVENI